MRTPYENYSGYDADVVLWDSHPLALGATPHQVWIDGVPQLSLPTTNSPAPVPDTKPAALQALPKVPNFDAEAIEALKYDGLPPLEPTAASAGTIVFANVSSVFLRTSGSASVEQHTGIEEGASMSVVVRAGHVVCLGLSSSSCVHDALRASNGDVQLVDLVGGAISPGLTTYGSALGLEEIQGEVSTRDGRAPDALDRTVPGLAGGSGGLVRAVDGLQFATRHA